MEFKVKKIDAAIMEYLVLIGTDWNLKEETDGEDAYAKCINRNRLEFKVL